MKLSLVVLSEGKSLGKAIPITLSQFIIGRDPQCQLRPGSALISKRHCAVITRQGKCYVRDFDSTNGTFINDEQVKGERELKHDDTLKVGPLAFKVVMEGASVPVNKPTPLPKPAAAANSGDDDSVAAMLLDIADESKETIQPESVPDGTTISEMPLPPEQPPAEGQQAPGVPGGAKGAAEGKPAEKKKAITGNTSEAAQAILQKYMRRQR